MKRPFFCAPLAAWLCTALPACEDPGDSDERGEATPQDDAGEVHEEMEEMVEQELAESGEGTPYVAGDCAITYRSPAALITVSSASPYN